MKNQDEKSQIASAAAFKANETSGAGERSRKAKMANWTRNNGRDDSKNPFSFQNYYTATEQLTVRNGIVERSSNQRTVTETSKNTPLATIPSSRPVAKLE